MDNKTSEIKNELSLDQIEEIKETFELLDKNKIDSISIADLKIGMMALGLTPSEEELDRIVKQLKEKSKNIVNYFIESGKYFNFKEFFEIVSFRLV
jgi:Ca2+-binding EF-hand superfamily protein